MLGRERGEYTKDKVEFQTQKASQLTHVTIRYMYIVLYAVLFVINN